MVAERMMKRRDVLALGLAALAAEPRLAFGQSRYPERPIRLVIPFPPGGVNDAIGRPWADKMKGLLGTVIVENQGGAGGTLGATAVARAQPDGYTIVLGGAGSHVINPIATTRTLYDPIKDFEPISILAVTGLAIVVNPSIPARSLKEFVDHAKANASAMSYGSAGAGTMTHLAAELFKSLIGTPAIVHVPYKGMGPALTDVISGEMRMLAVTTPDRLIAAPEIPTAVEAGLQGMIAQNFTGLFAPARTPTAIVAQISQATRTAMADREFRQLLLGSGFEPASDSNPDKTRRFVEEEIARWTPIIKSIGLKLD